MRGSYLGRSLVRHLTLCPCPLGPCHLPHTPAWLAAAGTWLKTCPASGVHSSGALSRPEVPGVRLPPPRTGEHSPPSGRVSPGVSPAAAPGPCGGVGLWLPTAFWCLTVYLVLAACLSPALSHLAMSLQAFPENPSQVNTLPLNPGLWDCFTEQFRELKPGHQWTDISLQKSIFFFFALT